MKSKSGRSDSIKIMTRLSQYVRPYLLAILLAIFSMSIVAASEPGIPALLKPLLDKGFAAKDPSSHLKWLIPVAVISLAFVRGTAQYASNYLMSWITNRILLTLRLQMFDRMVHASAAFFQRETASAMINAIVFEVNQLLNILSAIMVTLVRDSLTVIFLLGYLFYLNWQLTLIVALILPVIGWLVSKINRRLRRLNREHQMLTNQLSYIVEEAANGYKVIKVHHGESYELQRFNAMSSRLRGYAMRMTLSGGLAQPLTQFIASIALAVVITIAVLQSSSDQTTVGGFVAFITSMLLIISPLKHLIDINQPLQRSLTAAEFIFGFMDEPIEPDSGTYSLKRACGKVTFQHVSFSYGAAAASDADQPTAAKTHKKTPTLEDISITVAPGEKLALVGPSGSGKTTLVNLLTRFFEPTQGRILMDDIPINDYRLANLRHQIAFVSQEVVLFNDSIAANVAYGAYGAYGQSQSIDRARVKQALHAAYLLAVVDAMPEGIDTLVGDKGMKLSGGERQRLAIARAIYKDAPILILDEATSALDAESERYVQTALEALMDGRTTLVIAHRLSTIEHANRIIVLEAGRIVEQGNHAELLRKNGLYLQLYQAYATHRYSAN